MMNTLRWMILLTLTTAIVAACGPVASPTQPGNAAATPTAGVGIANPAAVYCQERGYRYEIRTASDGSQGGVCVFTDGSECEGWAYFRGECGPTAKATPKPWAQADIAPTQTPSGAVRADGWVGTIVKLPAGSQFPYHFLREDGQRYGIGSVSQQL